MGGHFNPITELVASLFLKAGYPEESIKSNAGEIALPGYFRPAKKWDLVVSYRGTLVAAFEMKALGGPSFGNNYNHRVEEAVGNAIDLREASKMLAHTELDPWIGYFFIMDDAVGSRRPLRSSTGSREYDVEHVWDRLSYQQQFTVSGQRLLGPGLYDGVCYVISSENKPGAREICPELSWDVFRASIDEHIAKFTKLGFPG